MVGPVVKFYVLLFICTSMVASFDLVPLITTHSKVVLIKKSRYDLMSSTKNLLRYNDKFITFKYDKNELRRRPTFITGHSDSIRIALEDSNCTNEIDEPTYYIDEDNSQITEKYCINDITITRKIGTTHQSIHQDFIKRRSDFQGKHFVAMTERSPIQNVVFKKPFEATFFENNQTWDVTDISFGMMIDIWHTVQKELNFTTTLYKRKDGEWGSKRKNENGDKVWVGMISNIIDGSANIILTSLTQIATRFEAVDYLQPWFYGDFGIYVSKESASTVSFEFDIFFHPFQQSLWLAISALFLISLIGYLILEYPTLNVTKAIHVILPSFFGQASIALEKKGKKAKHVFMFAIFTFGTLSWAYYNAGFTADLTITKQTWPFDSLESLLNSNYKLITSDKSTAEGMMFANAKEGTIYEEVRENKMVDEGSFGPATLQRERLFTEENVAVFGSVPFMEDLKSVRCNAQLLWKAPAYAEAIAIGKRFPFKEILDITIMRYLSFAYSDYYSMKKKSEVQRCPQPAKKSMAVQFTKLAFPFLVLVSGIFISVLLGSAEKIMSFRK